MIAWVNQQAEFSIKQCLPASIYQTTNRRDTTGHRLKKDDPEAFSSARHYIGISKRIVIRFFVFFDVTGKRYTINELEIADLPFESRHIVTVTDN